MIVTDGKISIDLSKPHKSIDGKVYQEIEPPKIETITEKSNPHIWAILQPKE